MTNQIHEIEAVIETYFKSYLEADADGLARAFYPETRLLAAGSAPADLDRTELADWLVNLRDRRARGDVRRARTRIDRIDQVGDAAMAKAVLEFDAFAFTDYLSLLRVGGQWRIVAKVYVRTSSGSC